MAGAATLSLALTACGGDTDDDEPKTGSGSDIDTSKFTEGACGDDVTSADTFKVGGILPLTGNLAFLGPPEIGGVGMAVSDINEAGGVGDAEACHQILDSGGTADMSVSSSSADAMVAAKPSVVIGAAASGITENIIGTITGSKLVQISPANTKATLSGVHPFYFRTAPPDTIQGDVLGNMIAADGHKKIAMLVFDDPYGTGLRDTVQKVFEAAGGEVVYGGKESNDVFQPAQPEYKAEVTAAVNSKPDAIVILAFDETATIIPELDNAGFDLSKTYYSDGNLSDRNKSTDNGFEDGVLEGARGTKPGVGNDDAHERINAWYEEFEGEKLTDFTYATESYDAVMLAALAAVKGGDTTPVTIQKNLAAVSGANGGEECTTYADCVKLLDEDKEIHYKGPSGAGPFNKKNDPSTAIIGMYTYDGENRPQLDQTLEGKS